MKITRVRNTATSETLDASCGGCQFFVPLENAQAQGAKDGNCHAEPPAGDGNWPPVQRGDWCGAFERVNEPIVDAVARAAASQ